MTTLKKNLAVVAMSGGVDSSVAALLLKEEGFEVIGISMKTHDDSGETVRREHSCCSAQDIGDARQVCQQLDIPFYPLNFEEEFGENVIDPFVRAYEAGRTPNPCILCNDKLKFRALLNRARQLGAYYLATGHYVQKGRNGGGHYRLLRARDPHKDQSYFLFGLGQEQLEHILFPVGRYTKEEIRRIAREKGLKTADKPESQEICFVSSQHYSDFIERRHPEHRRPEGQRPEGHFVDATGRVLGRHRGIHAYTVGQRRGLGVAAGERLYVSEIVAERNEVVLGRSESLQKNGLIASGLHWVVPREGVVGGGILAVLRYRQAGVPVRLWSEADGMVRVEFLQPAGPVTPGQAVVFYRNEEVLGGGWIEKGIG